MRKKTKMKIEKDYHATLEFVPCSICEKLEEKENEAGSTLQLLSLSASNCLFFGGFFGAGGLPRKKLSSGSKAKENI